MNTSQTELKKVSLESMDVGTENRAKLKALFPSVFTETLNEKEKLVESIDFEKLKAELGTFSDLFEGRKERYGMDWPGKRECLKIIQQPSLATLKPCREESVNFDTTENLFIEGDNLEVLKLLQKSYHCKVKMIYIDPPYNTGKEFIYPDHYAESLETYLAYAGLIDDTGKKFSTNTANEGRFHTKWLNMMYPRLYLARNLLREDGVIFISIDDNEVSNLRKLCDEIYGEENFVAQVEWQKRYTRSNNTDNFTTVIEHLCIYQKSSLFKVNLLERAREADARFTNPDNDPRGPWKATPFLNQVPPEKRPNLCYPITNPYTSHTEMPLNKAWRYEREKFEELLKDNRLWWGTKKDRKVPDIKTFLSEVRQGMTPINFWSYEYAGHTDLANSEIKDLFGIKVFDTPKPSLLLERIIEHSCKKEDIVLDFFAGSCPLAQAVLEHNRKGKNYRFIVCQLPEPVPENSQQYQMDFKTIADIGKERIRRVIQKIKKEESTIEKLDLGFKVLKLNKSNFKVWEQAPQTSVNQLTFLLEDHILHINPKASQEDILYELLLKSGYLPTAKIEKQQIAGKTVYSIGDGVLMICLESEITREFIEAVAATDPERFICLDHAFKGNDQLKTNAMHAFSSRRSGGNQDVFRTI